MKARRPAVARATAQLVHVQHRLIVRIARSLAASTIAGAALAAVLVAPAGAATAGIADAAAYGTQKTLPFSGLYYPWGDAVDSAGDVFVTDGGNHRVLKLAKGSTTQTTLPFTGLSGPTGVAVDSAGDVFVADADTNQVLEVANGATTSTVLPFGQLSIPFGVAVDGAGDVFVANNGFRVVLELAKGASSPTVLPFGAISYPAGVAVDSAGDVFVTDNSQVLELAKGAASPTVLPFGAVSYPHGVAVDSAGDVFVTNGSQVLELAKGASAPTALPFVGLSSPTSVAVDDLGDVFAVDRGNRRVVELPALVPTTTAAAAAPNPSTYGQPVTITATVAPSIPSSVSGLGEPTGNVTFADGSTILGTASLNGASPDVAQITVSSLAVGTHHISAAYAGTANYASSESAPLALVVRKAPTAVSATPALMSISPFGLDMFTLSATLRSEVTGASLAGQPVVFSAGSTVLCRAVTNASGKATCDVFADPADVLAMLQANGYTASFAGSIDYLPSATSAPLLGT